MNCKYKCVNDVYNTTHRYGYIGDGGSKVQSHSHVERLLDIRAKNVLKIISNPTFTWYLCEDCFELFNKAKSLFTDKTPHTINNLTVLIKLYPSEKWNFELLSENPALRWEIVNMFDRSVWDIKKLMLNPGLSFTNALELCEGNYDAKILGNRHDLSWSFVMEHADLPWDKRYLSTKAPIAVIKENPNFGWTVVDVICNSNLTLDDVKPEWFKHWKTLISRFGWKYVEKFRTDENAHIWDWRWIMSVLHINMWVIDNIPEAKLDTIKANRYVYWDVIMKYPDERWNVKYALNMRDCPKELMDKYVYRSPPLDGIEWRDFDVERFKAAGWSDFDIATTFRNCPEELIIKELHKPHDEDDLETLMRCSKWSVIKQCPDIDWDESICRREGFEYEFLLRRPDIDWDWDELSYTAPLEFIIANLTLPWKWKDVSGNYHLRWFHVYKYPTLPWNFKYISSNGFYRVH